VVLDPISIVFLIPLETPVLVNQPGASHPAFAKAAGAYNRVMLPMERPNSPRGATTTTQYLTTLVSADAAPGIIANQPIVVVRLPEYRRIRTV